LKLSEILTNFKQPIPLSLISSKKIAGQSINFVCWHNYCDLLDTRAGLGNWQFEIVDSKELSPISQISGTSDNGETYIKFTNARLVLTGKLTLYGDDRTLSFSATGEEFLSVNSYGEVAANCSAQALRRCCALAGLGRELWSKK
jgi:hypothetical protein